jgi:hypothetical protein
MLFSLADCLGFAVCRWHAATVSFFFGVGVDLTEDNVELGLMLVDNLDVAFGVADEAPLLAEIDDLG